MNVSPLAKTISGERYYSLAGRGARIWVPFEFNNINEIYQYQLVKSTNVKLVQVAVRSAVIKNGVKYWIAFKHLHISGISNGFLKC